MTTSTWTKWVRALSVGGIATASFALASPAQANSVCPADGLAINTIILAGTAGYTCSLGSISYRFLNTIVELNQPNSKILFESSKYEQKLIFTGFSYAGMVSFDYFITSPAEDILAINQTYTRTSDSPPPLFPPVGKTGIQTIPTLPYSPSVQSLAVRAIFEPNFFVDPPYPSLTSLTHSIAKTPAPLPLLGAGLTFACSRKLRRRLQQSR